LDFFNVPLAIKIMTTGYIWPISAWQEFISGELFINSSCSFNYLDDIYSWIYY